MSSVLSAIREGNPRFRALLPLRLEHDVGPDKQVQPLAPIDPFWSTLPNDSGSDGRLQTKGVAPSNLAILYKRATKKQGRLAKQ